MEKTLLLPHLKQVYSQFSNASCDFSSCLRKRFILSLAKSKTGCSKIGSIFLLTFWINRRWPKGQAETNFLVDFLFNKKLHKKKKKQKTKKTREKHPGRVAQDYKFAALMKIRKEEILRNKEQSTVQSTEQSAEQSSVQSIEQPSVQSMILISLVLVCLLSLPLVFVYFIDITLSSLKTHQ